MHTPVGQMIVFGVNYFSAFQLVDQGDCLMMSKSDDKIVIKTFVFLTVVQKRK